MFPATSLTLKLITVTLVLDSDTNCRFHHFPSEGILVLVMLQLTLHVLPILPFIRTLGPQELLTNKWTAYICLYLPRHALTCLPSLLLCKIHDSKMQLNLPKQVCPCPIVCFIKKDTLIWKQNRNAWNLFLNQQYEIREPCVPFTDRNLEQNSPKWPIWEQCVPFTDRDWEQNSPIWPIWERCVQFTDRNSEQNSLKWTIWEQCVPFKDRNSEQNSPKWPVWEQCVPFTDRNSEQNSPDLPIWEQYVPLTVGNSELNVPLLH